MTLEGQAKLLRILEGHPFLPVGGTQQVKVDVRVIAATNQDLQSYVRERKFREDLLTTPAAPAVRASRTAAGRSATLWMMTPEPSRGGRAAVSVAVGPSPGGRSGTPTSAGVGHGGRRPII